MKASNNEGNDEKQDLNLYYAVLKHHGKCEVAPSKFVYVRSETRNRKQR